MSSASTSLKFLLLVFLLVFFLSCASTVPPPPGPVDSQSCGIGLYLRMNSKMGPLITGAEKPEIVLFMRLNEGENVDDLKAKRMLIPSSFVDDGYAYLLNVPPGRYVAVAALYGEDVEPVEVPVGSMDVGSNVSVGFSLNLGGGEIVYRNYFSRDMIERSMTTVEPGSFGFMGHYIADQSFRFGDADDMQLHVLHLLEGEDVDRSSLLSDLTSSDWARRLTISELKRDRESEIDFCKKAKGRLQGSAWIGMIDRLMAGR